MRKRLIVQWGGGIVAAIGFCVAAYSIMPEDFNEPPGTPLSEEAAAVFGVGTLLLAAGLIAHLSARYWGRDVAEAIGDAQATAKEVKTAWRNPALEGAAGLFIFYGILGLFWGFAIDLQESFRPSDIPLVIALHLPHLIILFVMIYFAHKRGKFFGLTAWKVFILAVTGFALPIVFFSLTK